MLRAGGAAFALIISIMLVGKLPVGLLGEAVCKSARALVIDNAGDAAIHCVNAFGPERVDDPVTHDLRAREVREGRIHHRLIVTERFEHGVIGQHDDLLARIHQCLHVFGLNLQFSGAEDHVIVIFIHHLIGVGGLKLMVAYVRCELQCVKGNADFLQPRFHRQIGPQPRVRDVEAGVDHHDLDRLGWRVFHLAGRCADDVLQRLQWRLFLHLVVPPELAFGVVRQRVERQRLRPRATCPEPEQRKGARKNCAAPHAGTEIGYIGHRSSSTMVLNFMIGVCLGDSKIVLSLIIAGSMQVTVKTD